VQCRLEVGAVDDPAEREADRVADAIMRRLGDSSTSAAAPMPASPRIRRAPRRARAAPGGSDVVGPDGGSLSGQRESRIRRAEGGGTPLEPGVREQMEGAFGTGFADVRIHRRSDVAPELGAVAFTQGRHIHFAPDRYDPASEVGQRLLSHELAHVVQQSGGAPEGPVLRRKVGFEFETAIRVGTKDFLGDGFTGLGYQELIFTSTSGDWKIVADSSNMEFVTEPFTENPGGRGSLVTAMNEITNFAANIPGVVGAATNGGTPGMGRVDAIDPTAGTTETGSMFKSFVIVLNALTDAGIMAAPQATGGVRLDQIPTLIDRMIATTITAQEPANKGGRLQAQVGRTDASIQQSAVQGNITNAQRDELIGQNAKLRNYQGLTGVTPRAYASSLVAMNLDDASTLAESRALANAAVNAHIQTIVGLAPNFDKLKGLLTIVISYILVGHRDPLVMDYSKMIAPLMARTNFYNMYRLLAAHERQAFTEQFVLTAAGLAGTGGARMFAAGFDNNGVTDHGPTRTAWIDSIIRGAPGVFGRHTADLLSQGSGSTAAENSASLGSLGVADQRVTGQQDLAVLELRRLPKMVHRTEWSQMALDIFDLILALP
jgi:hypothetical protein